MAHITRIKAHDPAKPRDDAVDELPKKPKEAKTIKSAKSVKPEKRDKTADKKTKKPFILIRPFVALGHYLRDSWRELRQVRWPNRKMTWKMVLAVFVYTAVFIAFLVALDLLFEWVFSLILK